MNYLSVCSGIEAATVGWHHMGWKPIAFSEIEKFPSEVLNHHYPDVPNLGDMTKFKEWELNESIDILVGGTPCQSFSVAGLRKGLDDPRGNLALTYVAILDKFRPKWCVWENVPGVLSSGKGRDFGSFLGALVELGYGFAYRVLDAQHFGVAQRRRRVFVVGCSSGWEFAAKVLFESESLRRDIKTSKSKREETPGYVAKSVGTLLARDYKGIDSFDHTKMIAHVASLAPTLTSSGAGLSRVGNDTTADSQYVAYNITFCDANGTRKDRPNGGMYINETDVSNTITRTGVGTNAIQNMAVRRLTPIECERLQGFPDGYTDIKQNCPDGPRYKALGNSMAVPVMRWIGERINKVNEL